MTRLAVRKRTSPTKVRYSAKKKIATLKTGVKKTILKKKTKKAASKKLTKPIFVPRIQSFLNNIQSFTKQRTQKFGAKDTVAKKLHTCQVALNRELKKINIINPNMAKTLNQIGGSFKGVPNVPKALRMNYPKLVRYLRDYVRKEVIKLIGNLKKMITPLHTEFKKLEIYFNKELKKAKTGHIQYKIDPKIKSKFNTMNNNLTKFKTKWYKRLNTLALHGNRNVQSAVKAIKKEIDDMQKSVKRNLTIINRYAKTVKPKKGYKIKYLFNANQLRTFESKWKHCSTDFEKYRIQVENFFDQLKGIKLWK